MSGSTVEGVGAETPMRDPDAAPTVSECFVWLGRMNESSVMCTSWHLGYSFFPRSLKRIRSLRAWLVRAVCGLGDCDTER